VLAARGHPPAALNQSRDEKSSLGRNYRRAFTGQVIEPATQRTSAAGLCVAEAFDRNQDQVCDFVRQVRAPFAPGWSERFFECLRGQLAVSSSRGVNAIAHDRAINTDWPERPHLSQVMRSTARKRLGLGRHAKRGDIVDQRLSGLSGRDS
jgi:hypothetical protein